MPACASCQAENPAGAKFCLECGAPLAARCASCGTELPPAAKFCLECGAKVAAVPAPAAVASDRRTSPLAEKIRQAKPSIEGERKQVTVLFADVKGSMELAEQLDPEEWSRIMQRFFTILADGVERFEGFVDKFTGDGIMALFGAPIAHEDHAQRACCGERQYKRAASDRVTLPTRLMLPIECAVQRRRSPVGVNPIRQRVAPAGSSRSGERRQRISLKHSDDKGSPQATQHACRP